MGASFSTCSICSYADDTPLYVHISKWQMCMLSYKWMLKFPLNGHWQQCFSTLTWQHIQWKLQTWVCFKDNSNDFDIQCRNEAWIRLIFFQIKLGNGLLHLCLFSAIIYFDEQCSNFHCQLSSSSNWRNWRSYRANQNLI